MKTRKAQASVSAHSDQEPLGLARRDFLKRLAIGAPAGAIWLLTPGCASSALRALRDREPSAISIEPTLPFGIRYEVSSSEAARDLKTYTATVKLMQAQPEKIGGRPNGLNWNVQAMVHKKNCPHGSWKFFPWHREYLYRFEKIIAQLSGDATFKLPFWDWSKNPKLPGSFRATNSPLNTAALFPLDKSRTADISKSIKAIASPLICNKILSTQDFEAFLGSQKSSGELEYGPHNGVHVVMGNLGSPMGDFLSPEDPIFWLHHCNVDRLWAEWQEKNPQWRDAAEIAKDNGDWLKLPLQGFFDETGAPVTSIRYAKDVIDILDKGCNYAGLAVRSAANKTVANRLPANISTGHLEMRAFTRDEIQAKVGWNPAKDQVDVSFLGFREGGNVDRYLDACTKNPNDFINWVFRLRVLNFPKVTRNSSMRIFFKVPAIEGREASNLELTQYSFFVPVPDATESTAMGGDEEMNSAEHIEMMRSKYVADFNFDYKKLLSELNRVGFTRYPDVSQFQIQFFNAYSFQAVSVGEFDFSQLQFKVSVLEKVG